VRRHFRGHLVEVLALKVSKECFTFSVNHSLIPYPNFIALQEAVSGEIEVSRSTAAAAAVTLVVSGMPCTYEVKGCLLDLTFRSKELAGLCSHHERLVRWAELDAVALEQLLNEIDCAECLGQFEELPHATLRRAAEGRVGAYGDGNASVLLEPEPVRSYRDAEAAIVIAIAVGPEELNPEGAAWPRAFATSPTLR
jgi:hypothetical protein